MAGKWREAVWAAVQRQAKTGSTTRAELIEFELATIIAEVGSKGKTPEQTLSRELQELRDLGVLIFDGYGRYRIAAGLNRVELEEAIVTEVWRLQKARLGQGYFRDCLMQQWGGKCPMTGINEPALLRASHIIPWNRCKQESDRLDPHNGLLLSSLWDSAFDSGLVSFADDGAVLSSNQLSDTTLAYMVDTETVSIAGLTDGNRKRLAWHRAYRLGQVLGKRRGFCH